MSKYDALRDHLDFGRRGRIAMSFSEIDAIVDGLPPSARVHRAWWANKVDGRHVHAHSWQQAGYSVEAVDLVGERVVFRREG